MTDTATAALPAFSLNWPFVCGAPQASAFFRASAEDFGVDEVLGFEPSGSGEHVLLHLRKRGENTQWLAKQIARVAGVKPMDVGYCGLKDRHAVATQWFSVYLGNKPEPDWQPLQSPSVEILQVARHAQKLRRGMHSGNRFVIVLRQVDGDRQDIERRLLQLRAAGAPNYFGDQRFGREGGNLPQAHKMLVEGERIRDQQLRGLILSAARSYLFNLVVAARVENQTWQQDLPGDIGVNGVASAPLWGRGRPLVSAAALALESSVLAPWKPWTDALEYVGLAQERRALVMPVPDLTWVWRETDLQLSFTLGVGCFATALLRELAELKQMPDSANMV